MNGLSTLPSGGFFMKKRAILFVNGEIGNFAPIEKLITEKTCAIAVDGGLRHLLALKITPDLLIGDLDSVSTEQVDLLTRQGVELLRFPVEKDETDLELALLETARRGYHEIYLAGALGGRVDQTLANLFLLLLPELVGSKVVVIGDDQELFMIRDQAQISGLPGDIISLIPLDEQVNEVTTSGLDYPLSTATLYREHSRGISNMMNSTMASVKLSQGNLLCVHSWTNREDK